MSQSNIDVRGYTSFNRPVSRQLQVLSILVDGSIVLFIGLVVLELLKITPLPKMSHVVLWIFLGASYWFLQKGLFKVTLGERCWQIRPKGTKLYECDYLKPASIFMSCLLTTFSILISYSTFKKIVFQNPVWLSASLWNFEPFIPSSKDWMVTPFFYVMGGWPKTFNGKPILYSLPYEKGPPSRFIGHTVAYWDAPDIKLVLEGPKTPDKAGSQKELKECILGHAFPSTHSIYSLDSAYHCIFAREQALTRHIKELEAAHPSSWTLKWFMVNNAMLPPEDRPQGIYLSASGDTWTQDRFILINSQGIHQTLILTRPKNESGSLAFDLIQKTVRSLRSFKELDPGRAWVNQELEEVRLRELQTNQDPVALTANLAEIQSLLISRISVEPGSFDSYFHLAGTSMILLKSLNASREKKLSIALQNLQNAYHFAQDVAPADPRINLMQNLIVEAKKF